MMTFMGRHFGVPPSAIAYLPAAYGLAYGGFALAAGPLSDRLGRKRPLQAGLLIFAVLCALIPNSPNLSAAVALSGLTGVCAAIIQPNVLSLVGDQSSLDRVDQNIGRVFVGLMLAFALTPSIAGFFADSNKWQGAYYTLSLIGVLTFLAVSVVFLPHQSNEIRPVSFVSTHRAALATSGVVKRLSASYLWLGWMAGFGAIVADISARKLTLSPTDAGLLAGFFGLVVISGNLAGPVLRRALEELALPLVAFAASAGVIAFLLPMNNVYQLAIAGVPWAFGYGCGGPLHHARLSGLSAKYRGTINSYHASLLNLGIFSVSFLFGALVPVASLAIFCATVGGMSLIGASLLVIANSAEGELRSTLSGRRGSQTSSPDS
jgi:predicted MFS family arabinose efflux permease